MSIVVQKTSLRRLATVAFTTVAAVYLGVVVLLASLENRFVYHPVKAAEHWEPPPVPDIEEIELASADGNRLGAWWLPCPGSERSLLYMHGNAGNLSHRGSSIVKLRKWLDVSVLIVDYPGYGKSSGAPSEAGCYAAGDAGYEYLVSQKKCDPKKLILYGGSLGGAVAIDLATRKPHWAVVVDKTFTSAPDIGGDMYPWIPVRWIMRNRFHNIDKVRTLHTPIFISHGDRDRVIPFEHGEALFRAANEPKAFCCLPESDHNDSLPEVFFTELRKFLASHEK
jgi:fermentation-respiration switch protein FrsA (DUF1100 family)